MRNYLPPTVREIAEFQGIAAAEQTEFEVAWARAEGLLADRFVATASAEALARWESMLGIVPAEKADLESRRFVILTRLNERIPFTLPRLRELLDGLCGAGGCGLELTDYTLTARVSLAAKGRFSAVGELLERVTPLNLRLILEQCRNSATELRRFTHGELARFTHFEVREEVL